MKLALGELETPPGAGHAVFLSFHHPGIPGKIPITPETGIISFVHLTKRPGETVTAGTRLTVGTTAKNVDIYIELVFRGGNHKGLAHHKGVLSLGEIPIQLFAVY